MTPQELSTVLQSHRDWLASKAGGSRADLSRANLSGADLPRVNLSRVNLSGADLSGANLYGADLSGADLSGADLSRADLLRANLSRADLLRANLYGADLSRANLYGADLYGALNLTKAKNFELSIAKTRILPDTGPIVAWKKCQHPTTGADVIVQLLIPSKAKRSHAFGRKCRAEFAKVLKVVGGTVGVSKHDGKTEYRKGKTVKPDAWEEDWTIECASGIHFFITRAEAEAY